MCQQAGTLIWNLFVVGVEPLGQPELSLPTEEENKLDCHPRFLFLFSPMHENVLVWPSSLCGLASPYRGLLAH